MNYYQISFTVRENVFKCLSDDMTEGGFLKLKDYIDGSLYFLFTFVIVILAPSSSAMRILLQICDSYAAEYDINFNHEKSKFF